MRKITMLFALAALLSACKNKQEQLVTVHPEVVSSGYIGNGVEWDPYDEAEGWGAQISEQDWATLFKRLDFMRMGYVRCMINSPFRYFDPATGKYDKTRNIESISKLLRYCTDNNITVVYGEYNPPTWEMKADQRWVDMSVDYLNYLVSDLGFTCIKHFVIFNEPDGNWASTNGDYELWKQMLLRFDQKMRQYPGLHEKVSFAAPDVVMDYHNPASPFDAAGWVKQTAQELDSLVGVYDVHSYPGQAQVYSGEYTSILARHKQHVPAGKKIILGEAGYKYWREADSALMQEYNRRLVGHPYTKGSDCNMLVYDFFYGLDMPLLCMEVMNAGYSGIAAWMLDDAMHSNGDSGKAEDVKLWGMWNILGSEVFGQPEQEEIRPWYYTWALMCRYFPAGASILKVEQDRSTGLYAAAAEHQGKYTVALVNLSDTPQALKINLPQALNQGKVYEYLEGHLITNADGHPVPTQTDVNIGPEYSTQLAARSFLLITDMD